MKHALFACLTGSPSPSSVGCSSYSLVYRDHEQQSSGEQLAPGPRREREHVRNGKDVDADALPVLLPFLPPRQSPTYRAIIDDVIANVRQDFEEMGIEKEVLEELQRVSASCVGEEAWRSMSMLTMAVHLHPPVTAYIHRIHSITSPPTRTAYNPSLHHLLAPHTTQTIPSLHRLLIAHKHRMQSDPSSPAPPFQLIQLMPPTIPTCSPGKRDWWRRA